MGDRANISENPGGAADGTAGEVDRTRRDFLKGAGIAGAAAAGAAAPDAAEAQTFPPAGETRYALTPHVERYYFLNRL